MDERLRQVRQGVSDLRALLDEMMYCGGPVDLEVFHHLRIAYDKVCEANDELAKV